MTPNVLRGLAAAAFCAFGVTAAVAGPVIDRIRSENVIRCGGVPRPGLVGVAPSGRAEGLYLDVCRAIGATLLGPTGRIEFHSYDSDVAFDTARKGVDDVMFLTGSEIVDQGLAGEVVPGPTLLFERDTVMVADDSSIHTLADLEGQPVCYLQGDSAERRLSAWLREHKLNVSRLAYQEEVELYDAFNVQVCKALAGEATTLASVRLAPAEAEMHTRILDESLAVFPVLAATETLDGQFSSLVAWAIATLQNDPRNGTGSAATGAIGFPIEAPQLGLAKDWQRRVIGAAGAFSDIYDRNLGQGSRLKLLPGPNANLGAGGLLAPPYVE